MKSLISLLCFFYSMVSIGQISPQLTRRLDFVLDSVAARHSIKGVSAAIVVPGVGTWKGCYGVSQRKTPLTPGMLLAIGSNTKTFIATVMLKLQEQGLLDLDDTIGKWIKGYPNISGTITIRQCLNHTSGLYEYTENKSVYDSAFKRPSKIWELDEILLLPRAPVFSPGTNWGYSNTNYIVLGIIIREVLHKTPSQAITDLILKPHGLSHTYYYGENPAQDTMAHGWTSVLTRVPVDLNKTRYMDQVFSLSNTAGSLISTPEDIALFWHKLTSGQILSDSSWQEMTTFVSEGNGSEYGLGMRHFKNSNDRYVYSHRGIYFGFLNENLVDVNSGICITVMSNQDKLNSAKMRLLFLDPLHRICLEALD